MARILRKQDPPIQARYQDYKPYLRLDFVYRCAYCTIHEGRHGGEHNFQVEHFRPKRKDLFPELELVYSNLYYACNRCNVIKGSKWPTPEQQARGLGAQSHNPVAR